jgi:hypothetical protein
VIQVPRSLEITFINKALLAGETISPSERSYPAPGLDFSCEKGKPDMPLDFS